jgi:hypothetical protein
MQPNAQARQSAKPQRRSPVESVVEQLDGIETLEERRKKL